LIVPCTATCPRDGSFPLAFSGKLLARSSVADLYADTIYDLSFDLVGSVVGAGFALLAAKAVTQEAAAAEAAPAFASRQLSSASQPDRGTRVALPYAPQMQVQGHARSRAR